MKTEDFCESVIGFELLYVWGLSVEYTPNVWGPSIMMLTLRPLEWHVTEVLHWLVKIEPYKSKHI